jgi:predicted O-methyltransferase YrrM
VWRILKYLQHLFCLRHRYGHGIHSPYLFEVVNRVIFNAPGEKGHIPAKDLHRGLFSDRTVLPATGTGAPSRVRGVASRPVRSFVKGSSVSPKYGALLFRISRWFNPEVILELGTGIGVSALYLASGSPGVTVHTIEGNRDRAQFSIGLFKRSGLRTVQVHIGEMEQVLNQLKSGVKGRILAFVDGNHQYGPTLRYLRWIIDRAGEEAVVVMDDIYWSKGMFRAWQEIISWPETRVSINLFQMGILLLRRDLNKANLKIKF